MKTRGQVSVSRTVSQLLKILSGLPLFCGILASQTTAAAPGFSQVVAHARPVPVSAVRQILQSGLVPKLTPVKTLAATRNPKTHPNASTVRQLVRTHTSQQFSAGAAASNPYVDAIQSLALGLVDDPYLIYEYVHNNIEYEPLFGSNKGALGTLLDGRGSDIDQDELLVALLNAAGYTQTTYCYGAIRLNSSTANASSWLGVANDATAISDLFAIGGVPEQDQLPAAPSTGPVTQLDIGHVWVQVNLENTALPANSCAATTLPPSTYVFDPSFKQHTVAQGVGLSTILTSYNRSTFLSDAGSSSDPYSVSNISTSNVARDLQTYSGQLIGYLRAHPTMTVSDLMGGKSIMPVQGLPASIQQTTLPYLAPPSVQGTGGVVTLGVTIPDSLRTYFALLMPGRSAPNDTIAIPSDVYYGQRITVFPTTATAPYTAKLLLGGSAPVSGNNTSTPPQSSGQWTIQIAVHHPFADATLAAIVNQSGNLTVNVGGYFLLANGWGQVGQAMADLHRRLLTEASASGASPTSEGVLGEGLAVIGYSWLAESSSLQRLGDQIIQPGTTTGYYHGLGIVGESLNQQGTVYGPYVDLPYNSVFNAVQNYTSNPLPANFVVSTQSVDMGTSALESGVLEQTQAPTPNMQAASTISVLATQAASGKVYFADYTTPAGISYYNSVIKPYLTSSFTATDEFVINCWVTGGTVPVGSSGTCSNPGQHPGQAVIPANPSVHIGNWIGTGYSLMQSYVDSSNAGHLDISEKITGGLSGGFSSQNVLPPAVVGNVAATLTPDPGTTPLSSGLVFTYAAPDASTLGEPVDAITGAEIYRHTDLSVGNGDFPNSLPFEKVYNSAAYLDDEGMGAGWTNNFTYKTRVNSDPYQGMGAASPINSAAAIVGLYVGQDVLSAPQTALTVTVASVVHDQLINQFTNNSVTVYHPDSSEEFYRLPDGTFNAPLGSSSLLTANGANPPSYTYQKKDGETLAFNPDGSLGSWTFPRGTHVNLSYSNGLLSSVQNNLGRALTFAPTSDGKHILSVTDGSRSVGIAYASANNRTNLVSSTDPRGNATTFSYDTSGVYDTRGHLTQVFAPSFPQTAQFTNTYDGLERVAAQQDAVGNPWAFLLAGSRTTTLSGPTNNESVRVTYQTPRGQFLRVIDRLNTSVFDIYSDTAQSNGNYDVTVNTYDGLDRLVQSISPAGIAKSYSYDSGYAYDILGTITTPPAGSVDLDGNPLQPISQSWTYDPTFYEVSSATDGTGNVTTYKYDTATSGGGAQCGTAPSAKTGDLCAITYPAVAKPGIQNPTQSTRQFTYDTFGHVLTATDEEGRVTQYAYDSTGDVGSVTQDSLHLQLKTSYGNNSAGDVTSVVDPRGNVPGGTPASFTTNFLYDVNRNLTQSYPQALAGVNTVYGYDPDNRLVRVSRQYAAGPPPSYRISTAVYTPNGQLSSTGDPSGNTLTYAYDAARRVTSITSGSGRQLTYSYDALSRVTSITGSIYGPLDASITSNLGAVLLESRTYTPDGLRASSSDGNGNLTSFIYDGFDRLQKRVDADGKFDGYEYDANNNQTKHLTRAGAGITSSYDARNRLAARYIPANSAAPVENDCYGFDYSGRMLQAQQGSSATPYNCSGTVPFQFAYDTAGRRTSEARPDGKTVGFILDAAGNRTGTTWPDGSQVTYSVDMLNRITDAYDGPGTSGLRLAHYDYDSLSNRLDLKYGNGAMASYNYGANSILSLIQQVYSPSAEVTFSYSYNPDNQVTSRSVDDSSYQPGPSNPALTVGATTYGANRINQYTNANSTSFTYNDDGALLTDGTNSYAFDAEDRLRTANGAGLSAAYSYDPLGRRSSKTVNSAITSYVSAGSQEIAEYGPSGALQYRYVYGPGLDEPLARVDGTGTHDYFHADGVGSVVALTDSSANVMEKHVYTPFGVSDAHFSGESAYQFTGRRYDAETGLYYYRARYYSAILGRFTSRDALASRDPDAVFKPVISTQYLARANGTVAAAPAPIIQDPSSDPVTPVAQASELSDAWTSPPLTSSTPRANEVYVLNIAGYPVAANLSSTGAANAYAYANNDPLTLVDPFGLSPETDAARGKKSGTYCIECGAPHGGVFGPYCPNCFNKSKDPEGGVEPYPELPEIFPYPVLPGGGKGGSD